MFDPDVHLIVKFLDFIQGYTFQFPTVVTDEYPSYLTFPNPSGYITAGPMDAFTIV